MVPVHYGTYSIDNRIQAEDLSGSENFYLSTTRPTTVLDSPQPDSSNTTSLLHNINELMWLSTNITQPSITLNETNTVYQVLLNTVS